MRGDALAVEVAYALPAEQVIVALRVERGATLRTAIERSGILERFPDIDLARDGVGVFGVSRGLDEAVADGDRIEIYRALLADPKDTRRRRAAAARRK